MMQDPVQPKAMGSASGQVALGARLYYGATVQAGTGSTVVTIYDGSGTTGSVLDVFSVGANLDDFHFMQNGVQCVAGIWFQTDGADRQVVVYYGPL